MTLPLPSTNTPDVQVTDLRFGWSKGADVLDIADFSVNRGERIFLKGPSGSGKSTLLSLISGISRPAPNTVRVFGRDMARLGAAKRDRLRADEFGVVFQMFNLIPYLSVLDNVLLACRLSPARRKRLKLAGQTPKPAAKALLERLGLNHSALITRNVGALSVGQQQRVALARALIGSPKLIIADEPTSALDTDTRDAFLNLLVEACAQSEASLLFVSHDSGLSGRFDRIVDLRDVNRTWKGPQQ